MPLDDNKFIENLYHDFEQKLFKVFGFGIEDLKKVLDRAEIAEQRGHCLETNFNEAFKNGGAPQLRWEMNNTIVCLEYVFMSKRLGREATYEEWVEHVIGLDIGMTKDDLMPFTNAMYQSGCF